MYTILNQTVSFWHTQKAIYVPVMKILGTQKHTVNANN